MTSIDYTDPHQVFDRLAQIQHETKKRINTIDALTAPDPRIASSTGWNSSLATCGTKDYPVVTARAYDEHRLSGLVDYCLTIIDGSVLVKLHAYTCDLDDLSTAEITAALSGWDESRATTSWNDSATAATS